MTKRGKRLVKLVPLIEDTQINVFGALRGTVKFHANIIDLLDELEWEVLE